MYKCKCSCNGNYMCKNGIRLWNEVNRQYEEAWIKNDFSKYEKAIKDYKNHKELRSYND